MPPWILALIVTLAVEATPSSLRGREQSGEGAASTWLLVQLPDAHVLGHPEVHPDADRSFVRFNGRDDGYVLDRNPIAGWKRFTVQVWFRPDPKGPPQQRFLHIEGQGDTRLTMETRIDPDGSWYLDTYLRGPKEHHALIDPHLRHPSGSWHLAELRYDGRTMTSWVDGRPELSFAVAFPPMTSGKISLGVRLNRIYWYQGDIARVTFLPSAAP